MAFILFATCLIIKESFGVSFHVILLMSGVFVLEGHYGLDLLVDSIYNQANGVKIQVLISLPFHPFSIYSLYYCRTRTYYFGDGIGYRLDSFTNILLF